MQLDVFQQFLGAFGERFWTMEALFTDPRWNELRSFAKRVLTTFQWPVEVPPSEPGNRTSEA